MRKFRFKIIACSILLTLVVTSRAFAQSVPQEPSPQFQISGIVMELRSGTPDVVVSLCDQKTGIPISSRTRLPNLASHDWVTTSTGPRGRFQFTNVPPGRYRLVAQKWIGPFKGLLENNGSVIQLFGTASNIEVPSAAAQKVVLTPPGEGVLHLDQKVGNSETFFLLSTEPMQYDPILGFAGLGQSFAQNVIGFNRMPYGRTTIVGVPDQLLHAFYFAADNSPGFATQDVRLQVASPYPSIPFVAGWSDGRKEPPDNLKKINDLMAQHHLSLADIPGVEWPNRSNHFSISHLDLSRLIPLPDGKQYRVGDILAADAYRKLNKK